MANDDLNNTYTDSGEIMSLETFEYIVTISDIIVIPVIFLIGVPTNIINCFVLSRQGLKDRMNLCLFVLALADIIYICLLFAQSSSTFVSMIDKDLGAEYGIKITFYIGCPALALKAILSCINVVIAVERCMCVVFPLRTGTIMRTRTMALLLVTIVASMFLAHIFFPLKYDIANSSTRLPEWFLLPSKAFMENDFLFHVIDDVLLSTAFPILTFVAVLVSTAITVLKLRAAFKWRVSAISISKDQSSEVSLTKMLVLLSSIYIVCATPFVLLALARLLVPGFRSNGQYHNIYWGTHYMAAAWSAVNSAINFFVYYWRSSRFRRTLTAMCSRRTKTSLSQVILSVDTAI